MNTCWETLGIEPTTDLEHIRQAYLALLPSFHPESDPQGFKQLRQAYEEAQRWTQSPIEEAVTEDAGEEHERVTALSPWKRRLFLCLAYRCWRNV